MKLKELIKILRNLLKCVVGILWKETWLSKMQTMLKSAIPMNITGYINQFPASQTIGNRFLLGVEKSFCFSGPASIFTLNFS